MDKIEKLRPHVFGESKIFEPDEGLLSVYISKYLKKYKEKTKKTEIDVSKLTEIVSEHYDEARKAYAKFIDGIDLGPEENDLSVAQMTRWVKTVALEAPKSEVVEMCIRLSENKSLLTPTIKGIILQYIDLACAISRQLIPVVGKNMAALSLGVQGGREIIEGYTQRMYEYILEMSPIDSDTIRSESNYGLKLISVMQPPEFFRYLRTYDPEIFEELHPASAIMPDNAEELFEKAYDYIESLSSDDFIEGSADETCSAIPKSINIPDGIDFEETCKKLRVDKDKVFKSMRGGKA